MMETWRGQVSPDTAQRQEELFELLSFNDLCLLSPTAAKLNGHSHEWLDPGEGTSLTAVERLLSESCAIITCLSGDTGAIMKKRGLTSPWGAPHPAPLPYHAIFIRSFQSKKFEIHDPWFDADKQPVLLTQREFARIWTGHIATFDRLP